MLIYADTNIYARPFDDQSQLRIRIEAEAGLALFDLLSRTPKLRLAASDILLYEIENASVLKRNGMMRFLPLATVHVRQTTAIREKARSLMKHTGLHPRDALHLASAMRIQAELFLTCDEHFYRGAVGDMVGTIRIINPTQFPFHQYL